MFEAAEQRERWVLRLKSAWAVVRRGLMAVGHVLGTINTYVLLTVFYLIMLVWIRTWWLVTRGDPLALREHRRADDEGTWGEPDGVAAPGRDDLEHLF